MCLRDLIRHATTLLATAVALLISPLPAAAHGGATGVQDVVQDYGVLLFLLAVVLIGAGVLTWVMLSPTPPEDGQVEPKP